MEITSLGPVGRGWEDAEAFRQTAAKWAEYDRSAIATALMQEQLRKEEMDRQTRSMALDMLQGYGTPSERSQELYRPTSGIASALRGGGVMSNITPEGGYTVTGQEGVEPVPGMRDIQRPSGEGTEPIRRALMKKTLLGTTGELPEETLSREMLMEGERYKKAGMLAESAEARGEQRNISAEKRAAGYQETALAREDARTKRSLMLTLHGNTLNDISRREQLAEQARAKVQSQYMNAAVTGGLQLPGAQEQWTKTLQNAEATYNRLITQYQKEREVVEAQLEPLKRELGIPEPETKAKPTVDPTVAFDDHMKQRLDPSSYAYLTTSGLTSDVIITRAQQKGVTPEEYLDALIEVRNQGAKKFSRPSR